MSFSISVTVDDDGVAKVTSVSGKPPAGSYSVSGHAHNGDPNDYSYNTIGVTAPFASVSGGGKATLVAQ